MKAAAHVLWITLFLTVLSLLSNSCSKGEDEKSSETMSVERLDSEYETTSMVDSVFVVDSTANRVYTIYDDCRITVGTITVNASNQLRYTSQTTSTITIAGTSSLALTKGVFYFFSPNGSCTGNKILKVKFATGTQSLCSTFIVSPSCVWSYSSGGCTIINSYSYVSGLPPGC